MTAKPRRKKDTQQTAAGHRRWPGGREGAGHPGLQHRASVAAVRARDRRVGHSNRQTKALAASVRDAVRDAGFHKPRIEGEDNGEWIIVDCGAAVAHIMQPAIRQYYHLEEIWGDKPVRMKLGASGPKPLVKAENAAREHDRGVVPASRGRTGEEEWRKNAPPPGTRPRRVPRSARAPRARRRRRRRPARTRRRHARRPRHASRAHEAAGGGGRPAPARLGRGRLGRLREALPARDAARAAGAQDRAARGRSVAQCLAAERCASTRLARKGARRVLLDEHGTRRSTAALAERLNVWRGDGRDVALVIGGPDGLDPAQQQAARRDAAPVRPDAAACDRARAAGRSAVPRLVAHHRPPVPPRMKPVHDFVYLASQSPRRRQLLRAARRAARAAAARRRRGRRGAGSGPPRRVAAGLRAARDAAQAGRGAPAPGQRGPRVAPILCADTTVALGRRILGKPADAADAVRMLRALSGRTHRVLTAVAVSHGRRTLAACSALARALRAVAGRGHRTLRGQRRAARQGRRLRGAGGHRRLDRTIDGSHSGIMGLPLFETAQLLIRARVRLEI